MDVAIVQVNVQIRRGSLSFEELERDVQDSLSSLDGAEVEVKVGPGLLNGSFFGAGDWTALK
jgi:hypothetical protein